MTAPIRPLAELVSFLDSFDEPHILFDRDYRILAANAAYRRAHGTGRSVIGRTCYEVSHHYAVPCDQAGESCPLARSLGSGQRERVMHLHHTPKGESYESIELSPVRNTAGEITHFIEKMAPLPVARGLSDASGLVGRAPRFQAMLELVSRVAPSDATVLLQGESGTGKELVSGAIHQASRRAGQPFVAIDCSGLPETLFESELFGHERGAFTGATQRKIGLVEAASGGTLFLDEVGDIPLGMQVKLLRLLETSTYRRLGATEPRKADIRIISATHRPLREMVEDGRFRRDLYYRLNTFPIEVPPLRERIEDIPLLAEVLLRRLTPGRALQLAPGAVQRLVQHRFPGNVRELRNVLERASLMCDGDEIGPEHIYLEEALTANPASPELELTTDLAEMERRTLMAVVAAHEGSRHALAERLGISERTLYRKLKAYGLVPNR
ncbi:sigma-54 interaction domain-containing protein [Nitrogeniibacter aestuarii]|uniref:sigma-54 interaction domain-containing protein n=1 Tax=Nitrogeniibacter aestuarii TaxID=2815343 RepID=UPI001E47D6CF|nr:sigma 54-interacting transcriptional regulator [Nitrogeniibacter aestuarii]